MLSVEQEVSLDALPAYTPFLTLSSTMQLGKFHLAVDCVNGSGVWSKQTSCSSRYEVFRRVGHSINVGVEYVRVSPPGHFVRYHTRAGLGNIPTAQKSTTCCCMR